ncbi:MAG: thioredoxin domain-containing protein [Candidatus Omnitrophota bacterium]
MNKKSLFAGLAIAASALIGIIIGIGIIGFQVKNPLFGELFHQQKEILLVQEKIEKRLRNIEKQGKDLQAAVKKLKSPQREEQDEEDYQKVHEIPIDNSPLLGNKEAPVTIVEFIDIQCPFCARFHPLVVEAVNAFPDKVKAVIKNYPLPFHEQAIPAAKAALAAGEQGKYWEMLDGLLKNSSNLNKNEFNTLAKNLGLNMKKFQKDLKNNDTQWQEHIQKDISLGNMVEVRGTPTIYINGRKTKARNINSLKSEIESILKAIK